MTLHSFLAAPESTLGDIVLGFDEIGSYPVIDESYSFVDAQDTFSLTVNDSLGFNESLTTFFSSLGVNDTLAFNETLTTLLEHNLFDTLSFNEVLETYFSNLGINESFTFSDSLTGTRIRNLVVSDSLAFSDNLTRNIELSLSISDNFILAEYNYKLLSFGNIVFIPGYTYTKNSNLFTIQTSGYLLSLPLPLLGDSVTLADKLVIKKSVNNVRYTYVRKTSTENLEFDFALGRRKGLELRHFYETYNSSLLTVTNWRGEKWVAKFTNNPLDTVIEGRFALEREQVRIKLQFAGIRIN